MTWKPWMVIFLPFAIVIVAILLAGIVPVKLVVMPMLETTEWLTEAMLAKSKEWFDEQA